MKVKVAGAKDLTTEHTRVHMSLSWRGAAVDPGNGIPTAAEWQPVELPGRPAAFAGADAVAYRTEFADPRGPREDHAAIELDGVYAHARVWCNGEQVAEHDAYFEPLRVDLPVEDDNEVIVECRRPEDRFGGVHATDEVPDAAAVPGVWWGASLETYPDPYVESLTAAPRIDDEDDASVDVAATVVTDEPLDDRLTLSLRPEGDARGGGTMNRASVETDPGRATVTGRLDVRNPSLWWPHDLGDQPRYAVRAKLDDAVRTTVTGLRSVEWADGLAINGQRAPARGVNLVDGTPADVERAVEANANLVRAHAHVLSPAVYEACDEAGVLVWQDLPLTGPGEFDAERGRELAERLERTRRRHPSLAAVSVHDDPVPAYAEGLGSGLIDRLRFRWRAWRAGYDHEPAESVADAVSEVPTVPVVGRPGVEPDAATLYPGWEFGDVGDLDWIRDRYGLGAVVAEFGAGAPADENPPGDAADGEPRPARADGGVGAAQSTQATVVGRTAEALRRRDADALAAYALRDVGDSEMGLLGPDRADKPAFERLRRAYEPVQAVLADPTPGESDLVVLHDRPTGSTLTVEWDVDGEREQTEVAVDAYGRATVTTLSLSAGDDVTLAVAVEDDVARNSYAI